MLTSPEPVRAEAPHPIALLGFSGFERNALATYLRLMAQRQPAYEPVAEPALAQMLVVDADQPGSVQQALSSGLGDRAVYVGHHAPPGALACLHRPIDPMHLLRELDVLLASVPPPASALKAPAQQAPVPPLPAPPAAAVAPENEPPLSDLAPLPDIVLQSPAPVAPGASALVLDDSEIALRFLDRRLQELGITPFLVRTDREALALLAQQTFQVVLADIDLGEASDMDGLTLCQHIKRDHIRRGQTPPPVVLVSAHHDPVVRVRSQLAGSDAFLPKPLDLDELQRVLRKLLPQPGAALSTA